MASAKPSGHVSHSWTKGARMGEAKNPGPPNNHFWSCAPEARQNRVQWKGGERRPRAPQPNTGEQVAKGNSPGPNPHGHHLGQASGGSALGINQSPAATIHNTSSRHGSAQGKKTNPTGSMEIPVPDGRPCKAGGVQYTRSSIGSNQKLSY